MEYQYPNITSINVGTLKESILASTMTDKTVENINWNSGDEIARITFTNTLSAPDKTLLDAVIAGHNSIIEEEPVKIILQQGEDKRLKWMGYKFTAFANVTTDHNFTMPFNGYIQGGHFYAVNSKTGDEISFIILPGDVNEYKYLDAIPIAQGETFAPTESFGMTSLLPAGLPIRITYKNTDSIDKEIVFKVAYRLA